MSRKSSIRVWRRGFRLVRGLAVLGLFVASAGAVKLAVIRQIGPSGFSLRVAIAAPKTSERLTAPAQP